MVSGGFDDRASSPAAKFRSSLAYVRPNIGISACLMGQRVRYEGDHRRVDFVADSLAGCCSVVTFCPEVAIGLGVPRPPIQMRYAASGKAVDDASADKRVVLADAASALDAQDLRPALAGYGRSLKDQVATLDGYVFKRNSPSCGIVDVPVFDDAGRHQAGIGFGAFSEVLAADCPHLTMIDESGLNDPAMRWHFLMRLFLAARWRAAAVDNAPALIAFHSRIKYLLMAYSVPVYQRLGRLLADLRGARFGDVLALYWPTVMTALSAPVAAANHANALQHMVGYLDNADPRRAEIGAMIADYRVGRLALHSVLSALRLAVPLSVDQAPGPGSALDPVKELVKDPAKGSASDYLAAQFYLSAFPDSLNDPFNDPLTGSPFEDFSE